MSEHQAIITGGTGTLGQAIADALQQPGWNISTPGHVELDVRNEQVVLEYFERKQVDLLICAAGMNQDSLFIHLNEQTWDQILSVNFTGALSCAESVLPEMIARKSGHIIFISSYSALHPPFGQAAYATAKSALLGLTKDLAVRYGSSNIRINAVLPGFLDTKMTENVTKKRRAQILQEHNLGRFNTCVSVARFIRFLHHELPHTSGQVFHLDSRI